MSDNIIPGSINQSVNFALVANVDITEMKLGFVRRLKSDATSYTQFLSLVLAELPAINSAHAATEAIYLSADATGGNFFVIRVDYPDSAFAIGADEVICNVYDDLDNVIAHRIFTLDPNAGAYLGKIWYFSGAANTNTLFGRDGLPANKVSNDVALQTLVTQLGTREVDVEGTLTLTQSWHDIANFTGINLHSSVVVNGQDAGDNVFRGIVVTGDFLQGDDETVFVNSVMRSVGNIGGLARGCVYEGNHSIADLTDSTAFNDYYGSTNGPANAFNFSGANRKARFESWTGEMIVDNLDTVTGDLEIVLAGGSVVLNASCVSGNFRISGFGQFTDNSAGTTVDKTKLGLLHWTGIDLLGTGSPMVQDNGAGGRQWTANALELAPDTPGGDATLANQSLILADTGPIKDKTDNLPHSIERGVALANFPIQMFDTNGDPLGGANPVAIQIMKDGAAYVNTTNTPAIFLSDGTFHINLSAADTAGIANMLKCTATGARPTYIAFLTEAT